MESLPLHDRNGLFVRQVSLTEARHMVESGQAEAVVPGGWRDRPDIAWQAVRLCVDVDYKWSSCSLTQHDAQRAAEGDNDPDFVAKLKLWKFIGDDRAIRVGR